MADTTVTSTTSYTSVFGSTGGDIFKLTKDVAGTTVMAVNEDGDLWLLKPEIMRDGTQTWVNTSLGAGSSSDAVIIEFAHAGTRKAYVRKDGKGCFRTVRLFNNENGATSFGGRSTDGDLWLEYDTTVPQYGVKLHTSTSAPTVTLSLT